MPMQNKKELETWIQKSLTPRPFVKCPCGSQIPDGAKYCGECERLYNLGLRAKPAEVDPDSEDVAPPRTFPGVTKDHSGFSTTAPKGKFNPNRERM